MSTLGSRLTWRDGQFSLSQCVLCVHKARGSHCSAFPAGIPEPILANDVDHREPFDGDRGIRFKPIGPGAA